MFELRQSTAVTVKIGPFVDDSDGNTTETALTISQADVRLSKNGGNMAQKNESSSCTHDELGYYDCDLDATDTGTLGRLKLMVHESGALPVWHEYEIVTQNYWDSKYSTDYLQVDAVQISGDATAADNAELAFDGTGYGFTGCTMPTTTDVTNQVTADVTAISGDSTAADNLELMYDGTGLAAVENAIADALLTRDWTSVSGEAARSALNALRALRNKVSVSAGTMTVTEEDDSTSAWTAAVTTDASADLITVIDPA